MGEVSRIKQRQMVSRQEFENIVSTWAWHRWSSREQSRRDRNWYEAQRTLGLKAHSGIDLFGIRERIRSKAEEVYCQHKDADALEDWLEAERDVSQYHEVISS